MMNAFNVNSAYSQSRSKMSFQTRLETITTQATGFHRNVYVVFICTFFFGFLVFGGVYQVLVNLLLVRLGFGPEFVPQHFSKFIH